MSLSFTHRQQIGATEPVFAGHFPQHPILPGVLLIAMARQAASHALGRPLQLRRVLRQRFMRPVLPAMTLTLECRVADAEGEGDGDGDGHRVSCRWLQADGTALARAELVLA